MNDIVDSGYGDNRVLQMLNNHLKVNVKTEDYSEYLFDALIKDTTFWKVKLYLNKPKTVKEICDYMSWNEKDLSDFVNVVSKAVKNRKKLFDSRYHMFIRATDGVFITLGKHKELSLKRVNYTDDKQYRFFEIVTCSQCHSIYLLGSREEENGKICLKQKSNLGGENIYEAYLIGDALESEDDDLQDDSLTKELYELCPRCGFIRQKNLVHKKCCEHSEGDYITLTKVRQSEKTGRVTKCVKCGGFNNLGILRSFFTGQEASTSVIGTALFEELPEKQIKISEINDEDSGFDDGFDFSDEIEEFESKAKQFIAFSDNRQAAAFFATYFYETYQGFLYSRIVYDNIKKLDEEGKPIRNFVNDMSAEFKENRIYEMFDDYHDYQKESWKALLKELVNSYSRNSLIGLGLMKIGFNDDVKMVKNDTFHLTKEEVTDLCLFIASNMFEDNAIHHGQNFTESDMMFYSNNGSENSYVKISANNKYVKSFLPKTDHTVNKRYDYLQRIFAAKGLDIERTRIQALLGGIWSLFERNQLFIDTRDYSGKQVDINRFKVINTNKWYICPKCHRITAYNVAGVCPAFHCDGKLEGIEVKKLVENNHYYRIYNELNIKPLRVVEHTAQLSNEEAYKLQEMFKRQEIDVLSCSTTFEMGVDIGDLETVFMRNMPPTPSNYVQRAGRAGRSTKSAALALTFCNKSNHDFSFFENPLSMINGRIKAPLFKVENEKIGIRHLYSAAFAAFWKVHPEYFGSVGECFGIETEGKGYQDFKSFLISKPVSLKDYLKRALPKTLVSKFEVESFGWIRWLFDEPDPTYPNLKTVYEQYRDEIKSLYLENTRLEQEDKSNSSVVHRINTYTKENIIAFLSRNNILPKYGFPVDTVELQINDNKNKNFGIDLSRDLSMAISEYAPGCEVVAAGNLIKSRYIKRVVNKSWRTYDYISCPECRTLNIAVHHETNDLQELQKCKQCGRIFERSSIKTFIIPEFGFTSDPLIRKPSLIKPERTYRTEATLVAKGSEMYHGEYAYGKMKVSVTSVEDGEIAVLNQSDFYVCQTCGFALGDFEANAYTNHIQKEHKMISGYPCKNKSLTKYSLGYRFKTDALYMSLNESFTYEEAYSVLQGIILSACDLLNIDNNEIAGCLQYTFSDYEPSFDFVLYDTTPGGAGHVKRLASEEAMYKVLLGAYNKAKRCDCGGEEGDSSCYKCLRTYRNQQHHDDLKRKYIIDKIKIAS